MNPEIEFEFRHITLADAIRYLSLRTVRERIYKRVWQRVGRKKRRESKSES